MKAIQPNLLSRLLADSSEAIVFADLEGIVQFTNPAADRLYGYETGELIGQNVDIFNSHLTIGTEEIVESIKNTGRWHGVLVQRRKDDSHFHSELTVALILDEDKNPMGLGSHSRDVSLRLEQEKNLRESEEKYRRIFETSRDGIFIHIKEKICEANAGVGRILGYTRDEVLEMNIDEMIHEDDRHIIRERIAKNIEGPYTVRCYHKNGRILYLQLNGAPTTYEGQAARVVFVHDLTEKTHNEERIKNALREKDVLLGEIYHRTKNNMQVISSLLTMRSMQVDDIRVYAAFKEIQTKIESMSLVHQKLYESQNLSSLRLDDYISDLSELMQSSYATDDIEINIVLDLDPVVALIDTAMACGLIISELLSNTLKHAFQDRQSGEIRIELKKEADDICLHFSDDGIGVPPEFDFDNAGGLGLTTIQGIVRSQLSGTVEFSGENGLTCDIRFRDNWFQSRV